MNKITSKQRAILKCILGCSFTLYHLQDMFKLTNKTLVKHLNALQDMGYIRTEDLDTPISIRA